jgi:hypothetical protein
MRKTPRLATLVLGLALILIAIWRLYACTSSPTQLSAVLPIAVTASATAPARATRARSPGPALPLLSASAAADTSAALGAFEGKVVSAGTGKGIAGARVVLEHAGTTTSTTTGADGAFVFVPPEAGSYVLVLASADGHLPFAPDWDHSPITWTARPGARVSGFVLALDPEVLFDILVQSPTGEPVPGAEVRVLASAAAPAPTTRIVTDKEGKARAALTRDALVEARHASFAPGRTRVTLGAEAARKLKIRLRPSGDRTFGDAGSMISGRVVDADGEPARGARVVATIVVENRAAENADLHPEGADVSDADGAFQVDGLDPGTYDLVASDDEHAPARAQGVAAGAEGLTLQLGAGGGIRGVVRSASGTPVAAFSVLVSLARGPLEREQIAARSFLDAEGRYEIQGLGPGTYEVIAAALGSAPSAPAKVTIPDPPAAPVSVDLTLARGARLRGTVLDAKTQQPIAGARIELEGLLAMSQEVPLLVTATTGDGGTFELPGLGAGVRSLEVTAAGHHGRIVSGIVVAEADPPPITVSLTPTEPGEEPGLELVGIGAVLTAKDDALVIGQVLPGGGAAEVGLAPGDAILAIDGVNVTILGFENAIGKIRGPEDSVVVLTVRKAGAAEAADVAVPRRRIKG